MKTPWTSAELDINNPFTVSFIAQAVLDLCEAEPKYRGSVAARRRIEAVAGPLLRSKFKQGAIKIDPYPPSAYLTQLTYRVLVRLKQVPKALRRDVRDWSRTEIDKQIALISARSRTGDPLNLAFALILARMTEEPQTTSTDDRVLSGHALEVFFGAQLEDGSWPNSQPLFHYPTVGSAFCFDYELLTQLLLCEPLQVELLSFLPNLAKAAYRLQSSLFTLARTDMGQVVAWPSGHHPQLGGPESWSTASVYHFIHELDRLVAEAVRRILFQELRAVYLPPKLGQNDPRRFADEFCDASVEYKGEQLSLRDSIRDRFVIPIAEQATRVEKGGRLSSEAPMSGILFGPPGTSKTQLAGLIAEYLGWPPLLVDPSYLVQDGLDLIQARANRLFRMLVMAERMVVLLDEFDEMGRDRAGNTELLSRFITTAMLPKLASINDERKIVFLLATNYVSQFDAAFSRAGRFDMIIQVMPPTASAKMLRWPKLRTLCQKQYGSNIDVFILCLSDLTFLECKQLAQGLTGKEKGSEFLEVLRKARAEGTLARENDSTASRTSTATRETASDLPQRAEAKDADEFAIKPGTWADTCQKDIRYMRLPLLSQEV